RRVMPDESHWVVTASADHSARGRTKAIVQANHGWKAPLRRIGQGDGVVICSPRTPPFPTVSRCGPSP
ncbi:MAG: hypothetical protein B7Y02_12010, partial [Rhodobacterales bacterium 17-64-5]